MNRKYAFCISLFSAGWLIPACFAVKAFYRYLELELVPKITGAPLTHSFPFYDIFFIWVVTTACWLAAVIVHWCVYTIALGGRNGGNTQKH
jgi:hypothetical protein